MGKKNKQSQICGSHFFNKVVFSVICYYAKKIQTYCCSNFNIKRTNFLFYFRLFALKTIELDEGKKTRTKEAVQKEARLIFECLSPLISKTYYKNIELFNLKITNYNILL